MDVKIIIDVHLLSDIMIDESILKSYILENLQGREDSFLAYYKVQRGDLFFIRDISSFIQK